MIAALLLAATTPAQTAIDAERAFVADAQKLGQWTAFRKYAADDAYMFVPKAIPAHRFLKDRADPPVSVFWWPGRSYVSCDGSYAINTGPWVREWGKSTGYFTTVWKHQADGGWKWIYDAGDELRVPRAEGGDIKAIKTSCRATPTDPSVPGAPKGFVSPAMFGGGRSADGTLAWNWVVDPKGARRFLAQVWDGQRWHVAIDDYMAAPPK